MLDRLSRASLNLGLEENKFGSRAIPPRAEKMRCRGRLKAEARLPGAFELLLLLQREPEVRDKRTQYSTVIRFGTCGDKAVCSETEF
jgi:hypothetical protein